MSLADGIGVHAENFRLREQGVQLLLRPLGTHADVLHGAAALRAGFAAFFGIAAVVAHHPPVGGVIGQIHAAPGALGHIAALGAQQLPAAAPAVEKQDALLPGLQILLQLPGQLPADAAGVAVPQLPAHIRQDHPGHPVGVVAPPQQCQLIVPPAGVIRRFHRGGGRTQQQPGVFPEAAVFGDIPCVIAGRIFGFVGALLLLVQDDQPQVLQRGEHRRPGTQHDVCLSPADALPLVVSLRQPQAAVQQGHLIPEIGGKPGHHLGRQGDFRHQDHHGPALGQQGLGQADIHQGLAAAGDPLQKGDAGAAIAALGQDLIIGPLLLIVEGDLLRRRVIVPAGDAILLLATQGHQPRPLQAPDALPGHAGVVAQLLHHGVAVFGQEGHGVILPGGGFFLPLHPLQGLLRLQSQAGDLHHPVLDLPGALRLHLQDAPLFQGRQHPASGLPQGGAQVVPLHGAVLQQAAGRRLPLRQVLRQGLPGQGPHLPIAVPHSGGQDGADGVVKRAEIPLPHPQGQADLPVRDDGLPVHHGPDGLDGFVRHPLPQGQHDPLADAVAPPEGRQHPHAHGDVRPLGDQIVVRLVNGIGCRRHSHLGDLRHGDSPFCPVTPRRRWRCRWTWHRSGPRPPR